MPFTKETASEAGKRGNDTRWKDPAEPEPGEGLAFLRREAKALTRELVRAAKGNGPWKDLSLEKRFAALKLALEYGVGRPRPMTLESEESDEETETSDDFSFETPA